MKEFIRIFFENRFIASLITILLSMILYNICKKMVIKARKKHSNTESKIDKRKQTYIKLITNILKYAFIIITILIILQINGVNVNSMIAGIGIVSVVVGLALQDALKDIIMGFNIIMDNFFSIGDVIKYNNIEGKVIEFGLKTTKIQDTINGNIISISNRNITEIIKISDIIHVTIPMPYEIKTIKAENIIELIIQNVKQCDCIEDCKYIGISNFESSEILYKLEIKCLPEYKWKVTRETLRCIKITLDENNIAIPYQQICIHEEKK